MLKLVALAIFALLYAAPASDVSTRTASLPVLAAPDGDDDTANLCTKYTTSGNLYQRQTQCALLHMYCPGYPSMGACMFLLGNSNCQCQ